MMEKNYDQKKSSLEKPFLTLSGLKQAFFWSIIGMFISFFKAYFVLRLFTCLSKTSDCLCISYPSECEIVQDWIRTMGPLFEKLKRMCNFL